MGRVFANGPGDLGSIPGRIIPKTTKMVLDTSLLNTQQYKVCMKGKVKQSRERSSALYVRIYLSISLRYFSIFVPLKITKKRRKKSNVCFIYWQNGNPCTTIIPCYSPINISDESDITTFINGLSSLAQHIPKHNVQRRHKCSKMERGK